MAHERAAAAAVPAWQGWLPWILVSAIVIVWTFLKVAAIGQQAIQWPGLHNAISITLYHDKPYAAIWNFQPLGTGTAILVGGHHHRSTGRIVAGRIRALHRSHHAPGVAGDHYRDADRGAWPT